MRKGGLYRHINNTTVALEVLKCFYVKEKKAWKLRVRWWNVGSKHAPWCMNLEQRITLPVADFHNWLPMSDATRVPEPRTTHL